MTLLASILSEIVKMLLEVFYAKATTPKKILEGSRNKPLADRLRRRVRDYKGNNRPSR